MCHTSITGAILLVDSSFKKNKKLGSQSKQRRQDNYRAKKDRETDAVIMNGIFVRLKISVSTTVASTPIAKKIHPVTTPRACRNIPNYVNRIWDRMKAIGSAHLGNLILTKL